MSLTLKDIGLRTEKKPVLGRPSPFSVGDIEWRGLTEDELIRLNLAREYGYDRNTNTTVATLRERHREIARLMCVGFSSKQIAELLGIHSQTVYLVKNSPAFQSMLSELSAGRDADAMRLNTKLRMLAAQGLDRLQEIADDPEFKDYQFLHSLAKDALDRSGHGVISKSVNLNASTTAEELAKIRETVYASEGVILEEDDTGSRVGRTDQRRGSAETVEAEAEAAAERDEGGRAALPAPSGEDITAKDAAGGEN